MHSVYMGFNIWCNYQALENASIEKTKLKEQQENELKVMHEKFAAKETELKSEHTSNIQTMTQNHMKLLEAERICYEEKLINLQQVILGNNL